MSEPLTITLDVENDPAALTAAFGYAHLRGDTNLRDQLRQVVRGTPEDAPFVSMPVAFDNESTLFDALSRPDGTVATMKDVLGKLGVYPLVVLGKRTEPTS